jgi:hypothetical protein
MSTSANFDLNDLDSISAMQPGFLFGSTLTRRAYLLEDLTVICRRFFSRRVLPSFQTTGNTIVISKLPHSYKKCILFGGTNPHMVYYGGLRGDVIEGELICATAQVEMASGVHTIELKTSTDIRALFAPWVNYTTPIFTDEESANLKAENEAKMRLAEETLRVQEAAKKEKLDREAAAKRAQEERDAEERRRKEDIRKRHEEEERRDPSLGYASISNAVTAYFADFEQEYSGYNNRFVRMDKGRYTTYAHITCFISPSVPSFFSPRYPDAIEIKITNEWVFPWSPQAENYVPPTERGDVIVMLQRKSIGEVPRRISILAEARVESLQRVSDLRKCLAYLFPTDQSALGEIARTLREFNAKKNADTLLEESRSRVRKVVRSATDKFLERLKLDISVLLLGIENSDGAVKQLSVAEACRALNLNMDKVIYDELLNHARNTGMSALYPQVEAMVDRLLTIK